MDSLFTFFFTFFVGLFLFSAYYYWGGSSIGSILCPIWIALNKYNFVFRCGTVLMSSQRGENVWCKGRCWVYPIHEVPEEEKSWLQACLYSIGCYQGTVPEQLILSIAACLLLICIVFYQLRTETNFLFDINCNHVA